MSKMPLVMAELFLTVGACERFVCTLEKKLFISSVRYLPTQKQNERKSCKAQRKGIKNEKQRCEHHCIVPVIYTAGCTALVFKYKGLKGAKKQYAHHIADRIKKAY